MIRKSEIINVIQNQRGPLFLDSVKPDDAWYKDGIDQKAAHVRDE